MTLLWWVTQSKKLNKLGQFSSLRRSANERSSKVLDMKFFRRTLGARVIDNIRKREIRELSDEEEFVGTNGPREIKEGSAKE